MNREKKWDYKHDGLVREGQGFIGGERGEDDSAGLQKYMLQVQSC